MDGQVEKHADLLDQCATRASECLLDIRLERSVLLTLIFGLFEQGFDFLGRDPHDTTVMDYFQ